MPPEGISLSGNTSAITPETPIIRERQTGMSQKPDTTFTAGPTAGERRQRVSASNRKTAALLAGVAVLFLAAALGVGALVLYGPF